MLMMLTVRTQEREVQLLAVGACFRKGKCCSSHVAGCLGVFQEKETQLMFMRLGGRES